MHVVIYMNQKWKIVLSTCLVIAICFTMASAAIESPFTKSSFDKSSAAAFAEAKASAMENMKTGFEKPAFNPPDPIEKPEFPDVPEKPTLPEITRPAFNPLPAPTIPAVPWPATGNLPFNKPVLPNPGEGVPITITKDEAEDIALAQFPGGNVGVIGVTYKRINAPAYPLAVNIYWVVEVSGEDPVCAAYPKPPGYGIDKSIPLMPCTRYGGQVIIDAVTGEVLYVNGWA